jgi:hypothetical protein
MNIAAWLVIVAQIRVVAAPLCGRCVTRLLVGLWEVVESAYKILRRASCVPYVFGATFRHGPDEDGGAQCRP